jgi:hypothetical protein
MRFQHRILERGRFLPGMIGPVTASAFLFRPPWEAFSDPRLETFLVDVVER